MLLLRHFDVICGWLIPAYFYLAVVGTVDSGPVGTVESWTSLPYCARYKILTYIHPLAVTNDPHV